MAGVFEAPGGVLASLWADPDPEVAAAALRSAGRRGRASDLPYMIDALGVRELRAAALEALILAGAAAVPPLESRLYDAAASRRVRGRIPRVLSRIQHPASVRALLRVAGDRDLDRALRARALRSLSRLHARAPELPIRRDAVLRLLDTEIAGATRYADALAGVPPPSPSPTAALLRRAVHEAWQDRRVGAFRCVGLMYPPDVAGACTSAVASADDRRRASALEFLEQSLGRDMFRDLGPVLRAQPGGADEGGGPDSALDLDDDAWVAHCAATARGVARAPEGSPMDVIEKVFALQNVDLFFGASSAHLALIAEVAEEVEADAGTVLLRAGEPVQALYTVVSGEVTFEAPALRGVDGAQAGRGLVLGSLSLLDGAPTVGDWRVRGGARLLRISRADLEDVLEDAPELATALLRGMAYQVREAIAGRAQQGGRADPGPVAAGGLSPTPQSTRTG
jgi:CRP-like cAMP-binding protein